MLNLELEVTLNLAFKDARVSRHEFMTVEHLLLALLDNREAAKVLRGCGVNLDVLRHDLRTFIENTTPLLAEHAEESDTQPTLGFQRVLQRAVFHGQSSGKQEVGGASVLVAIFSEADSHAVYLLQQHNVQRLDVVSYISHGVDSERAEPGAQQADNEGEDADRETTANPLLAYAQDLNEQARQGRIDPLIGREHELERVAQILSRRRKNNPLLVGEAGVG